MRQGGDGVALNSLDLNSEQVLKNYRFWQGHLRRLIDDFLSRLPQPYRRFAILRYVEGKTMECIAEEMDYSPRSMYVFRRKVLDWWRLFINQESA